MIEPDRASSPTRRSRSASGSARRARPAYGLAGAADGRRRRHRDGRRQPHREHRRPLSRSTATGSVRRRRRPAAQRLARASRTPAPLGALRPRHPRRRRPDHPQHGPRDGRRRGRRRACSTRSAKTLDDDGDVEQRSDARPLLQARPDRSADAHGRQPAGRLPAVHHRPRAADLRVLHRRRRRRRCRRRGCACPRLLRPGRAARRRLGGRAAPRSRWSRSRSTSRSASRGSGPASASCSFTIGIWFLYEPLPGDDIRPRGSPCSSASAASMLTFIVGMPSMVRTRFATPTIGREWMIGEMGSARRRHRVPRASSLVGEGRWRARTNRATPLSAGEHGRVSSRSTASRSRSSRKRAAARDYRERR